MSWFSRPLRAFGSVGGAWWRGYADACRGLSAPVWHLALVALVSRCGMMVMPYLVLYLMDARGLGQIEAGLVISVVGLAGMLGQHVGGTLTDRIGPRPVQLTSLFVASFLFVLAGVMPTVPLLVTALVVLSFVSESFRPANLAAIAAYTTSTERPRAIALQRLAVNLGVTFGPLVGGLLADVDFALLFWCNGAVWLVSAVILAVLSRSWPAIAVEHHSDNGVVDRSPWRDPVLLVFLVSVFAVAMCFMQFQTGLPLVLDRSYGFDKTLIGVVFAMNTVLIVLFEMPLWRRLSGRDNLVLVALGGLFTGVGFALTPLGSTLAFAWGTVAIWTVGEMLHATAAYAFVTERAGPRYRGRYMGAMGVAFGLAVAIAPLAGTALFDNGYLWWLCGILGVLSAVIALALRVHLARAK